MSLPLSRAFIVPQGPFSKASCKETQQLSTRVHTCTVIISSIARIQVTVYQINGVIVYWCTVKHVYSGHPGADQLRL